ncbi:hypothetical protein [Thiomonas sp. FB-6]|uniref:hypothetical protein n=1 Tax=Thiomonas sp. FB-6 TaxID=1158291 RepID=UPI00037E3403|nr:hypothetical protein [Thiomonas sp. FB-6]
MGALIARKGVDLEVQICAAFDQLPPAEVGLFVWLPDARKLFQAYRGPRVSIDGDDVEIADGYEVDLFPVRYSPLVMRRLLRQLGLLETQR